MAYLNNDQLSNMGFKYLGCNIKISDKAAIYDCSRISIGDNSRIDDFCVISGLIEIGKNVHVTPMCLIAGGEQGVMIGDFSTLAYRVSVFSQSDDYLGETMANSTVPQKYKNEYKSQIIIGRHVIIGSGSIIMLGVSLSEGCSIGAMSLVTKNTLAWGVYYGVPAKRIKNRKQDFLRLEKEYLNETNSV